MNNYYLSGLPRSGSTLLFSILKQNPEFENINIDRKWGRDDTLPELMHNGNPKIILTYRPILEVLASFVKLAEKYPATNFIDRLMKEEDFPALSYRPINDARCDWLMRPYGAIDLTNTAFKNMAIHNEWFHLVTYNDLSSNTEDALFKIYDFLGIESFRHNLENIQQQNVSDDEEEFGIPTLHKIKPKIIKSDTKPEDVLSDYVIQKYSNAMNFFTEGWLQSRL
jgi:hypothetical protein